MSPEPSPHVAPIVLASGSRYRAAVLAGSGIEVAIDPPGLDERALDGLFDELGGERFALELARRKADLVAPRHPGAVVVAADQVGLLGSGRGVRLLTKCEDAAAAVDQLMSMSGTTHQLLNGVVVVDVGSGRRVEGVDRQRVTMRRFGRDEASRYVQRFEPFDTAGSYRIEDAELMAPLEPFVIGVDGEDPSGVLGMPLPLLRRLLAEVRG